MLVLIRISCRIDNPEQPMFQLTSNIQQSIIMTRFVQALEKLLPQNKINIFGKGDLLMSCVPYYSLIFVMLLLYHLIWTQPWFLVALIYAFLPFLDQLFIHDFRNPNEQERKELEKKDVYFQTAIFLTVALDWFIFVEVLRFVSSFSVQQGGVYRFVGMLFAYSQLSATQFTVAHEIYHKGSIFHKLIGTFHLTKNLNTHFGFEHIYGHHRRVATPEDPATSPQHMSVYRFFWKSFTGTYKSVFSMQRQQGKSFLTNYAVLSPIWSLTFTGIIYYCFGLQATIFFVVQALFSIFYLETINYIEHYGLLRNKLENGQYQKVNIRHSWNAPHRITNYLLFKLQRHSDHHENCMKPYQTLLSLCESPQLPHGYSLMVSLALFPKSWFKIMNPLVDQYKRVGKGSVRTETTEKAIYESRLFAVEIALLALALWGLELLL